ncbi:MAG: hypothetical protein P857_811 [Candidatus Xenolissoclinum pacificiensis L6]|uniref:Uncharacterized protein n=1 Tax=Candidatus Xenolissoclinum pacificiensis L6 TaxID=1401685 RepID=W2UZP9_9RICK|nr:MAG: hypothetical protein P857_811 [Candidatus Xenolissoclinum pacificiensis L6]
MRAIPIAGIKFVRGIGIAMEMLNIIIASAYTFSPMNELKMSNLGFVNLSIFTSTLPVFSSILAKVVLFTDLFPSHLGIQGDSHPISNWKENSIIGIAKKVVNPGGTGIGKEIGRDKTSIMKGNPFS